MTCKITHQLICLKAILVVNVGSQMLNISPEIKYGGGGGYVYITTIII